MEADLQQQREMLERLGSMWQGIGKPHIMRHSQKISMSDHLDPDLKDEQKLHSKQVRLN